MKAQNLRLVIDTNIWISYAYTPRTPSSRSLKHILTSGEYTILRSDAIRDELSDVLSRPRKKEIPADQITDLWRLFDTCTHIEVTSTVEECRDPKDNFMLALAKDARADHLLSSDNDLLTIRTFHRATIQRLGDFCRAQGISGE
jgi:uncharacterized protein